LISTDKIFFQVIKNN